ncbi:hypothetical protein VE02_08369 [Pseudogymnoascus sp. 03VT05]|nr:hypothetical protein VE02_08369 [Pseudogymnoascus sp. 03VT05]
MSAARLITHTRILHGTKSHLPGGSDAAIASALDICTDVPLYMVYDDGELIKSHCSDNAKEWMDDHVAFLVECSYSFEAALTAAGLPPRHTPQYPYVCDEHNAMRCGRVTSRTYVVSMRPDGRADVERVRELTRSYVSSHDEHVAWGWEAVERLGIKDINGDMPLGLGRCERGDYTSILGVRCYATACSYECTAAKPCD